jgi:hypothetical protein
MPDVAAHNQRLVKEDILGLLWRYLVTFPVLDSVRFIPIESDTLAKRIASRHDLYISHIHNYWKIPFAVGAGQNALGLSSGTRVAGEVKTNG